MGFWRVWDFGLWAMRASTVYKTFSLPPTPLFLSSLLPTFISSWPLSLHLLPPSLALSHQSPRPLLPRTRQLPANVSRQSTLSSVMTSSPISANTTCRRSPLNITDVCVTYAYMPHLRLLSSPIHCPMQSMDYNVPGGKLNRGLSVVDSVAILKGRELTDSEYFKAAVLGWAVEWVRICLFPLPCHSISPLLPPARKAPSIFPRCR
jgi:hypothetical protein